MSDSLTRAERRAQSRPRSRTGVVIGAALVVVAAVAVGTVLLASGGSSGDGGDAAGRRVARTNVTLQVGEVTGESAGPPITVDEARVLDVIDTIGEYLETAIVEPLRTGRPAGDLAAVFDAAALARATGVDRAALVDEGIPKVTGDLTVNAQPVAIVGLGNQDGNLVAITATVDLDISAPAVGKDTPLHIVRTGSFVLSPDAAGTWKVSAYTVVVTRDGGGIDVPSSTAAAPR